MLIKKLLCFLLTLVLISGIFPLTAMAADTDFSYTLNSSGNALVTGYSGLDTVVEVPESLEGHPVTVISSFAFLDKTSITQVILPDTLKIIGFSAFMGCTMLSSINIPDGVTKIENHAFNNCLSLTSITIPASVSSIVYYPFSEGRDLAEIIVDDDNAYYSDIDGVLFNKDQSTMIYCPPAKEGTFSVPESVKVLSPSAFENCRKLTQINIPATIKSWPDMLFFKCESLSDVYVPDDVILGKSVFYGCKGLKNVRLPAGLTQINYNLFFGCAGLTGISLPESINAIMSEAFANCRSLKQLEIPSGVTSIGSNAFANCSSLTQIEFPQGISSIEPFALRGCENLQSFVIPQGVKSIGNGSFEECKAMESITIPQSVTSIDDMAFYDCSSLKEVALPQNLEIIEGGVFANCESLENVSIPGSVKTIAGAAFSCCYKLESLTLPAGLTEIGSSAFYMSGLTEISIPDSVKTIGMYAFGYCPGLKTVHLPAALTSIEKETFLCCKALETVNIPDNVTSIAERAFGETNIQSLVLPDSVTSIGEGAFWICPNLESVRLPNGLTEISNRLFLYCKKLNTIELPGSVKNIGWEAFSLSGLKYIKIPKNVSSIAKEAFYGCENLQPMFFGNAPDLAENVFDNCENLMIYYILGATGFSSNWHGYPTAVFNPDIVCNVRFLLGSEDEKDPPSRQVYKGLRVLDPYVDYEPERTGFAYGGWYKDEDTYWDFAKERIFADTVIRAKWYPYVYDVVFDAQGGKPIPSYSAEHGAKLGYREATRPGYVFLGWYKEKAYIHAWNFKTDTIKGKMTLYAKWTKETPIAIQLHKKYPTAYGSKDGQISAAASGGSGLIYEYSINNRGWSSDGAFTKLPAGIYTVAVRNKNKPENMCYRSVLLLQPASKVRYAVSKMPSKVQIGTQLNVTSDKPPKGYVLKSVSYASGNTKIASVDAGGKISLKKGGKVKITVKTIYEKAQNGKLKTKVVKKVKNMTVIEPVSYIYLDQTKLHHLFGTALKLKATVITSSATDKRVTWKTSNKNIAVVSSSGTVKFLTRGTVTISCVAKDGNGAAADCVITVY
jgi:uncharacterized repeat protein (TIGR02543 family)